MPSPQGVQLLAPAGEPLRLGRDLLGVDGIGLHPRPGVRLVITGTLQRGFLVADLDLQPLARPRLLRDRSQVLERARLLVDLVRRRVAQPSERLAWLLADEPIELCGQLIHPSDVGFLFAEHVLGGRQVIETERAQLLDGVGLGLLQLGLHLGATAEAAIDLDVPELLLHLRPAPEPEGDEGEDEPDPGCGGPEVQRRLPEVDDPQGRRPRTSRQPRGGRSRTSRIPQRDRGRQVGSGATSNWTATSPDERGRELADLPVEGPQSLHALADDRQRVRRWVGLRQRVELGGDLDRFPETVVPLLGGDPFRGEPLGLAGLLEHAPAFGQALVRIGASLAGARQGVAVLLQLGEGQLALLDRHRRRGHGLLGDLEMARVLVALGRQAVQGALELLLRQARAAVGAADARLEPVAQGRLVAREVAQLVVAHGGRGPEERFGGDAGQLGHDLVGERRVRDGRLRRRSGGRPCRVARRTSSRACPWPCGHPPRPARIRWRSTSGLRDSRPTGAATRGRRPSS